MNRILRSTNIQQALRTRQKGFILNPYAYGSGIPGGTPVEYVGMGSAANGTTTFGGNTVLEGDLIYYALFNQGSSTIPNQPTGYTTLFTDTIPTPGTSPTAVREIWKIATASQAAPGAVIGCNRWLLAIFRNADPVNPFGATAVNEMFLDNVGSSPTTFAFPGITCDVQNNTSHIVCFLLVPQRGTNNSMTLDALPSNLVERRRISGSNTLYGIGTSGPQNNYVADSTGSAIDRWAAGDSTIYLRTREVLAAS